MIFYYNNIFEFFSSVLHWRLRFTLYTYTLHTFYLEVTLFSLWHSYIKVEYYAVIEKSWKVIQKTWVFNSHERSWRRRRNRVSEKYKHRFKPISKNILYTTHTHSIILLNFIEFYVRRHFAGIKRIFQLNGTSACKLEISILVPGMSISTFYQKKNY